MYYELTQYQGRIDKRGHATHYIHVQHIRNIHVLESSIELYT